jgi:hypothetical protein
VPKPGKKLGRPPELAQAAREEIAREFYHRMQAWAAAQLLGRDRNIQARRKLDARMRERAKTHALPTSITDTDDEVIRFHPKLRPEMEKLQAEIDRIPNKPAGVIRRAKGPRTRFIREIAAEFGTTQRMVVRCINEFDFGK